MQLKELAKVRLAHIETSKFPLDSIGLQAYELGAILHFLTSFEERGMP